MKLKISIVKYKGAPPSNKQDFLFDQEGGSIGRSKNNTWTLPDERNFLSRVQALVIFQNEKFYLIDKSSNGCFINQARIPIGRGISHVLNDNDIIRMGEYELCVNYIKQTDIDEEDEAPFDLFSSNSDDSQGVFLSNDISQEDIASDDPFGDVFRPKYKKEDKYTKPVVDSPLNSSTPIDIPRLEKEKTTVNNKENITGVKKEKVGFTQIFAGQEILDNENDVSPFQTQESDLLMNTDAQSHREKSFFDKIINEEEIESINPNRSEQSDIISSPPTSSPPTTIKDNTRVKKIRESSEKDHSLFEEIFKAAGINTQRITIKPTKEIATIVGQVLQEALQGTMELLRSRAETKDIFRVGDKTIISVARNNPLKFLPTSEHVITQLIIANDNSNLAYTPLVEAIQESFDDLKAHQFALSMSIQEALSATIKDYFSPQSLQEKLEKSGSISSVLPWQKKANLWKLFEKAYESIEEEASEQFQLVLERKIANAYEAHLQQIKQQRL